MDAETAEAAVELTPERYAELSAHEQFVLTVSERGFGKRSSSYEYRISGRGGKGITAMIVNERNGRLIASFPIEDSDQIMLVTDAGKLIRCPVDDVRIAGRNTQGVRIFKTDEAEKVVSVERIPEDGNGDADNGNGEAVTARASRRASTRAVIPDAASRRSGTQRSSADKHALDPGYRCREFRDDNERESHVPRNPDRLRRRLHPARADAGAQHVADHRQHAARRTGAPASSRWPAPPPAWRCWWAPPRSA